MNVKGTVIDPDHYYVCQKCTACCKWPGDVRIEEDEIPQVATFLKLTEQEFIDQFTRLRSNRKGLSIIEKPNHECIMLENGGCRIHAVKPEQCKGFPNADRLSDCTTTGRTCTSCAGKAVIRCSDRDIYECFRIDVPHIEILFSTFIL